MQLTYMFLPGAVGTGRRGMYRNDRNAPMLNGRRGPVRTGSLVVSHARSCDRLFYPVQAA
jgi:hypothetical protein